MRSHTLLAAATLLAALLTSCGDNNPRYDYCRFDPAACAGGLGGTCRADNECATAFCCRTPKECGGGTCTLSCRSNLDCPQDMGCQHEVCLFLCQSDFDCAAGQHCGHDHTVCEW
jgi:hypothetical protein